MAWCWEGQELASIVGATDLLSLIVHAWIMLIQVSPDRISCRITELQPGRAWH